MSEGTFDMVANITGPFDTYVSALKQTTVYEKTEHTDRDAIKALLQTVAPSGISVVHEPKRVPGKGAPDFKIRQNGQIVGYVEAKPIGADLNAVLKSDQISRYKTLSKNILVTDYLSWIWIKDGIVQGETLCYLSDIQSAKSRLDPERISKVGKLLSAFCSLPPQKIGRAQVLADALASRGRLLRDFLGEELERQERLRQPGRLYGLYSAFRSQVSESITLEEFADAFAQTLSYGLFLSKLNANGNSLGLFNAKQYIPKSFKLIQELVSFLDVLDLDEYKDIRWVVDEILSSINGIDVRSVKEDLSFRNRKSASRSLRARDEEEWRLFSRDPFIYFYEDYLAKYDDSLRKCRGVYYTPPPVVNFIVRAIDDTLKNVFGSRDGLGDHKRVTVLDFACGTGTFIVEIIERIVENVGASSAKVDLLIKEHVLKNIFAFEYLIAPYTIAHLKLAQYLEDRQIHIGEDDRFNILLTNTLERLEPQRNLLLPALSDETEKALSVKNKPILVITGNPPYSGHSSNRGAWITEQVRKYREGIPELSKPGQAKWLQDDYVKFIRFAQNKMDGVPEGMVAIITNNSYLDNPTFRGMRKSLMDTFNQIYILDLHGSLKRKERGLDGGRDENVFDIQQGVAIAIFIKKPGAEKGVWRADLRGSRLDKYRALSDGSVSTLSWERLEPLEPLFLFSRWDTTHAAAYNEFWSVRDIFSGTGDPAPGIVTTHDEFAISFTADEATAKVDSFLATRDETEARQLFRLCSQDQWNYERAKKQLSGVDYRALALPLLYRPFDYRWTIWDSNVAVHRRERVMRHMSRPNMALITSRMTKGEDFSHVQVSSGPSEVICLSPKTSNNGFVFPLYRYIDVPDGSLGVGVDGPRIENFGHTFRSWIDARYGHRYKPEEVFGYIFAILHSRIYRNRYMDLLRFDFPRIPFPESKEAFETLAAIGLDLAHKHLLEGIRQQGLGLYEGRGNGTVETVRYVDAERAVYINAVQRFAHIAPEIWSFQIGGYRPLEKYLKSRRGRALSLDDINTVADIANVIAFTLERMKAIDLAYEHAFPSH